MDGYQIWFISFSNYSLWLKHNINATHVSNVWLHLRWKLDTTGQRYMVCSYFTRRRFMYHAVWYNCDKIQSTNIFQTERCFFPTTTSVHRTRTFLLICIPSMYLLWWFEMKLKEKERKIIIDGFKYDEKLHSYKMAKNPPPVHHKIPP